MITSSLHGNNRLIRKTILRMFPSCFASTLTVSAALMVDTLLAGALLGQQAIAAVAIGLPAIGIFQSLTQTVTSGAGVKMAVFAGRGDHQQLNRTYSLGIAGTVLFALIFIALGLMLAEPLTMIFGGALNPAMAAQSALYLRAGCVCILAGSLDAFLSKTLALYGLQKYVFRSALISMLSNIAFSILFIRLLPDRLAITGLGAGTAIGGLMACLSSFHALKKQKVPLRFKIKNVQLNKLPEIMKLGFPTSASKLADNLVAGIINNLIVAAFGGDTTALAVYTAVEGVCGFADTAQTSLVSSTAPLLGVLYGSRDKNGILRTLREGFKLSLLVCIVWSILMYLLLPVFAAFYDMVGNPHFRAGVIACLLFAPLWIVMHLFIQLFESTEKSLAGLLYSSVPDSILYPLLLALLLPSAGFNGIWLAYNANALVFLLVLYLIFVIKNRSLKMNADHMLFLDESIRDNVPVMDLSIRSSNTDVTGISSQVHRFLKEQNASERTAYMTALCLEELAADLVEHTMQHNAQAAQSTIMDIKLFSDQDSLRIIIRNAAAPYNPLDFELNRSTFAKVGVKLAQKVARRIDYNYVYRLNIITIDIDK